MDQVSLVWGFIGTLSSTCLRTATALSGIVRSVAHPPIRPECRPADLRVHRAQCGDVEANVRHAMQTGRGAFAFLLSIFLREFQQKFNLRRRGFGSLHHGNARRSDGIPHTIRHWYGHYDAAWRTLSGGHSHYQRLGIVFDRFPHDASYGAIAAASKLAISVGCGIPWRLHNVFQLRVGDAQPRERWWPVARHVQYCRKCVAWIHGRLAGLDHRGKALIEAA